MRILDSNIIIYSANPEFVFLRRFFINEECSISSISIIEVLGYAKLKTADKIFFEAAFKIANILPLSDMVIYEAVQLRQTHSVSLADAIIAATAITSKLELVTRNTDDFKGIRKLKLFNPFEK